MGKWLYGEYASQIDLLENPDFYLDVLYKVHSYEAKEPWNQLNDKVEYEVSHWMRLTKCSADEVDCKISGEFLKKEFDDLIMNHLEKIYDSIQFEEDEPDHGDEE